MKFDGKIIDGKPKISNLDKYQKFFEALDEGDEFEIKVVANKDLRNHKMNNLYWLWLTQLSNFSGYTKRELHNYFKQELLCIESSINGGNYLDCKSTSELSIAEFSDYLKEITRLASQNFSFVLVDPDQL